MTEYQCQSCGRTAPISDWIYNYDEHYDELYIICPVCHGEARECREYEDEEEEDEEESEDEY